MTMKNRDMPSMPVTDDTGMPFNSVPAELSTIGLTKREMMAMAAMQGLCAHSGDYHTFANMASDAVNYADALLAQLELTK